MREKCHAINDLNIFQHVNTNMNSKENYKNGRFSSVAKSNGSHHHYRRGSSFRASGHRQALHHVRQNQGCPNSDGRYSTAQQFRSNGKYNNRWRPDDRQCVSARGHNRVAGKGGTGGGGTKTVELQSKVVDEVWKYVCTEIKKEREYKTKLEVKQANWGPYGDWDGSGEEDSDYDRDLDEEFDDRKLKHLTGVSKGGLKECLQEAVQYWGEGNNANVAVQCPCERVRQMVSLIILGSNSKIFMSMKRTDNDLYFCFERIQRVNWSKIVMVGGRMESAVCTVGLRKVGRQRRVVCSIYKV